MHSLRIGIDTGGTFTDVVLYAGNEQPLFTHKLLSTPHDPSEAVLEGLREVLAKFEAVPSQRKVEVIHGSTVATNALLERKGGRAGLITTAGFEDVLLIARQDRPSLYSLQVARQAPPIPRELVLGAKERMDFNGAIRVPLDEAEIDRLEEEIRCLHLDSLAICLLHSYANKEHEERLANRCRAVFPSLHLTVSHEILPEFREYERTVCCAINAAVAPPMVRYIRKIREQMGERELRIMGSNGGSLPPAAVEEFPALTSLSGPAGGVLGALKVMKPVGLSRLLTLDMGGTSTDVALCDGELQQTTEAEINSWPLRLPMLDIETVGAGGGSLAFLDAGGALQVGPASMGSYPGPACYGFQERPYQPTVTDAHLVLGHLSTEIPLAGRLLLSKERAVEAIEGLVEKAGGTVIEMAQGILRVAEATMARAIQRVTVARGVDPRDFALVPFGGAGGLHACQLAESLGITKVGLPPHPGLLSALGMLGAAPKVDFSQAVMLAIEPSESAELPPGLLHVAEQLQEKAARALERDGVSRESQETEVFLDLRFLGQSYEITVPASANPVKCFLEKHRHLYGYVAEGRSIQAVAVRVKATGPEPEFLLPTLPEREEPLPLQSKGGTRLVSRERLRAGDRFSGPLLLMEYSATTVVPKNWSLWVHSQGQITLTYEGSASDEQ